MTKAKPLRQAMPTVAGWIDEMRAAFGPESINAAIKSGIDGQPTFWASENGRQIGTKAPPCPERTVSLAEIHLGPMNPANAPKKGTRHG